MENQEKWIVLLAPEQSGGGVARPVGLFTSREDAVAYMEQLPTVVGLRAVTLRLEPPGAPVS